MDSSTGTGSSLLRGTGAIENGMSGYMSAVLFLSTRQVVVVIVILGLPPYFWNTKLNFLFFLLNQQNSGT